jgi:hypothetical protein
MTLYKYLKADRIDVLENRELRFTQASALNDPFELNPYFESIIDEQQLVTHMVENPIDIAPYIREAYDGLDAATKQRMSFETLLEFARQALESEEGQQTISDTIGMGLGILRDLTPQLRGQLVDSLRTQIGILSLSEAPDNVLLWAHYADQHRGFVVGFDETNEFFNRSRGPQDEFFHLRQVAYRPPHTFVDLSSMDDPQILVTKSPDWTYEHEWRMLIPISAATRTIEGEDPIYLYLFPPLAVRSVIIGALSSAETQSRLHRTLSLPEYAHVTIHVAELDDRNARITFSPLL